MRINVRCLLVVLLAFPAGAWADDSAGDAAIRQRLIQDSIASYTGACACPYSTMRNGRRCGGRSAYSKPGGRAPLCYPEDVTPDMIEQYRQQMR